MVCLQRELPGTEQVLVEPLACPHCCQAFFFNLSVALLGCCEQPGDVGNWLPMTIRPLEQYTSNAVTAGVGTDHGWLFVCRSESDMVPMLP